MLFNIYVGNTLYLQTFSAATAFNLFDKWRQGSGSVRMEFIQAMSKAS